MKQCCAFRFIRESGCRYAYYFERDEGSMKYVGFYWTVFAPLMKKSISKRFNKALADKSIRQGKLEYRRLLSRADDLGPGNPMALNAYFAYVFAGA